jgi:hypothetical protein
MQKGSGKSPINGTQNDQTIGHQLHPCKTWQQRRDIGNRYHQIDIPEDSQEQVGNEESVNRIIELAPKQNVNTENDVSQSGPQGDNRPAG